MDNATLTSSWTVPPEAIARDRSAYEQQSPMPLLEQAIDSIESYAREKPWSFGLWMMGVGFLLGWKLKFW